MPKTKRSAAAFMDLYIDEDTATRAITAIEYSLDGVGLAQFMRRDVEPYFRARARSRFANEGDDVVGKWAPLHPATEEYRDEQGFGSAHPINIRTEELFKKVTQGLNEIRVGGDGATFVMPGSSGQSRYFKQKLRTAQIGKPNNPKTVPRPVLGMGANDLIHVLERLALHVTHSVGADMGMSPRYEAWDG